MTAQQFVQLLAARVGQCASIDPEDRTIPVKYDVGRSVWVFRRGSEDPLFQDDEKSRNPLALIQGGRIELYIRIRELKQRTAEVVAYRLAFFNLPGNANQITSLRYDQGQGYPKGQGWDDVLADNPEHPHAHLHMNFHSSEETNHCRLPTGPVCPILLLRSFDHWYYSTFI